MLLCHIYFHFFVFFTRNGWWWNELRFPYCALISKIQSPIKIARPTSLNTLLVLMSSDNAKYHRVFGALREVYLCVL
jgi:hypothetical protein